MTIAANYQTLLTSVASAVTSANTVITNVGTLLDTEAHASALTNAQRVYLANARTQAQKVLKLQAELLHATEAELTGVGV